MCGQRPQTGAVLRTSSSFTRQTFHAAPSLSRPLSSSSAGRVSRTWSHSDLRRLEVLEKNTRSMLEQATNSMRLPFVHDDSMRTLSIPLKSQDFASCRKKRSTAMLDVAGIDTELKEDMEMVGEELPIEQAIERIKAMQIKSSDPKAMLALSGILGELQAGVCQLRFRKDGSVGRYVTLHALRIRRPEDDHVLMQVGRWRLRNGFVPMCGYPGSKRPSAKDFNNFIDFLIRELKGVLGGQPLTKTGSTTDVFKEQSPQFGTMTTYRRMLQQLEAAGSDMRALANKRPLAGDSIIGFGCHVG
ncbi:unnamed protein product [Effrenium voratum]|nr:unnamed protein product [Effrenium voratum]